MTEVHQSTLKKQPLNGSSIVLVVVVVVVVVNVVNATEYHKNKIRD